VLFRFSDINPKGSSLSWDRLFPMMFSRGTAPAAELFKGR
jgi:hypothetical protein